MIVVPCHAQTWGSNPELNAFANYYVKSLNEFMHRFNADEIPQFIQDEGEENMRQRCILALFDLEQVPDGKSETAQRVMKFDSIVCARNILLHITDPGLYAEARCLFKYNKKDIELNLVLVHEYIRDDYYRWAIAGVNGLVEAGIIDTAAYGYINPVQHELYFSELSEAFPHMNGYISRSHDIDQLSFLAGLAESGTLQLVGCQTVTYWFTQMPGYVFSVSLHPRLKGNAGWLIHDLIETTDKDKLFIINYLLSKK
jgi:hypothetical protein